MRFAWIAGYVPSLRPGGYTYRVALNLGLDPVFAAGSFGLKRRLPGQAECALCLRCPGPFSYFNLAPKSGRSCS